MSSASRKFLASVYGLRLGYERESTVIILALGTTPRLPASGFLTYPMRARRASQRVPNMVQDRNLSVTTETSL